MKLFALLFTLSQFAFATPWEKTFKPTPGWQTSAVAEVRDKSIEIQTSGKPFFTNAATPKKGGYLPTIAQFGDCTVEAQFLIPKGSNSGIYLQGRYEIQILDSHGREKPTDGDMGAVYHRWDDKRTPKGFEGHPPKVNAAKPAGEWQILVIKFRAPRLSNDGTVLEKPRFLSVHLNGKLVQENVTVHGHTRSAQRQGFADKDHIFIQGDHGPIAFRKFEVTPENF
ncbi:MAG: hypothetical protein ACJAVK_000647 [Akkermansiaceae bacterium]|jgi:hypothetical protein